MKDLLPQIETWLAEGLTVALATVIKTWGSSPRQVGAGMAVSADNRISGSVSGGCVEGAVIDAALSVLKTRKTVRLKFGVADDEAWEVGLACGGEIEVFIRVFGQIQLDRWKKMLNENQVFCSAVVIGEGPHQGQEILIRKDGTRLGDDLSPVVEDQIQTIVVNSFKDGSSYISDANGDQDVEVFCHLVQPKPTLILVGGVHIAIPLVGIAETLGFDVIVIDPRRLFGSKERFPSVKKLITEWPQAAFDKIQIDPSTAIVMLTHDPKIDDPSLITALDSPAFYVGALGSKKTHQKRVERLAGSGVRKERLDFIHAPVGLDLGGRSPEEIALSIMAEIVRVWYSRK